MKTLLLSLIAGVLAAPSVFAGAPATAPAAGAAKPDGNACTWFATVQDWRRLDDRNLVVWGTGSRPYHVELSMTLPQLGSTDDIAFIDSNGDGRLCGFGMDRVVIPGGSILSSASIANMTLLDEAALAALGEKYRVNVVKKKSAGKEPTRTEP